LRLDSAIAFGRRLHREGWLASIALGALALAIYMANGRQLGSYDTEPATLLPQAILAGDGIVLDRFARAGIFNEASGLASYVSARRGHFVSRYPIGPALVALPLIAPQRLWLDRTRPGWRGQILLEWAFAHDMAKLAAAILAALTVVALHRLLWAIGLKRWALLATLTAAFGSTLWVIGSQALWQHGPAALALTLALLCLVDRDGEHGTGRLRVLLAGLATGVMVGCRLFDGVFAMALLAWVAWRRREWLGWFLAGATVVAAPILAYNIFWFGTPLGGQAELEALHPEMHGLPGPWSWDLRGGLLGTLASPSRGLFVFMPWVALALVLAPWSSRRLRGVPAVPWVLWALVPYGLLLSCYAVWWGGFSFGPRYWTDAVPLLTILLACGLEWSAERARPLLIAFGLAISVSVAIQALGAWRYPSSWSLEPTNIDRDHARLWDWSDSELTRLVREMLHPPPRR
jgi:hypothetical protein